MTSLPNLNTNNILKLVISLTLIIAILGSLRLYKLNYSNFTIDEVTVLKPTKDGTNIFSKKFVYSKKKGPLQYAVPKITSALGVGLYDELGQRIPFALLGIGSILLIYLLVLNITASHVAGVYSSLIFGVNGLTVGLTRIVQYQSINMFFSILSLVLFFQFNKTRKLYFALLGSLSFAVSFTAHWDAVLVLPLVAYYVLSTKDVKKIALIALTGFICCGVFAIPYGYNLISNQVNQDYLATRLEVNSNVLERIKRIRFTTEVYNPFVFIYFFVTLSLFTLLNAKKRFFYSLWFVLVIAFYLVIVKTAGTHIYNILIPFSICCGLLINDLLNKIPVLGKAALLATVSLPLIFFWYQSYILFVDSTKEYPWEREKILGKYKTKKYTSSTLPNYKLGFTNGRPYNTVREKLMADFKDYDDYTFVTNDYPGVVSYYLNLKHGNSKKMFVIATKNPFTFKTDTRFPEYKKSKLFSLKNAADKTIITVSTAKKK